jgi:hypothetical protein
LQRSHQVPSTLHLAQFSLSLAGSMALTAQCLQQGWAVGGAERVLRVSSNFRPTLDETPFCPDNAVQCGVSSTDKHCTARVVRACGCATSVQPSKWLIGRMPSVNGEMDS